MEDRRPEGDLDGGLFLRRTSPKGLHLEAGISDSLKVLRPAHLSYSKPRERPRLVVLDKWSAGMRAFCIVPVYFQCFIRMGFVSVSLSCRASGITQII